MENYKTIETAMDDFRLLGACVCYIRPMDMVPMLEDLGFEIGNNLVIHTGLKEKLSPEEFAAIYAHEEGHIYYGHMKSMAEELGSEKPDRMMLSMNQEWEYQADEYAAKKCGAANMISALFPTVEWLAAGVDEDEQEWALEYGYEFITERVNRLEALL